LIEILRTASAKAGAVLRYDSRTGLRGVRFAESPRFTYSASSPFASDTNRAWRAENALPNLQ